MLLLCLSCNPPKTFESYPKILTLAIIREISHLDFITVVTCPMIAPFTMGKGRVCCTSPVKVNDTTLADECDGTIASSDDPENCCSDASNSIQSCMNDIDVCVSNKNIDLCTSGFKLDAYMIVDIAETKSWPDFGGVT